VILIVDPDVKSGIKKAIEQAQQKMIWCEEKRTEVKNNYSDVETESCKVERVGGMYAVKFVSGRLRIAFQGEIKKKKQAIQDEEKRRVSASTRLGFIVHLII
jgi:hypothetical protein